MPSSSLVPLLFALPLAACVPTFDSAPEGVPGPQPLSIQVNVQPDPSASAAPAPLAPTAPEPSLVFDQLGGLDPVRARSAFAPHLRRLGECMPGSTGVVVVRLRRERDATHYVLEPSTTLDSRARTCVLETLSNVELASAGDGSPSARPSGFTALLRFEWSSARRR